MDKDPEAGLARDQRPRQEEGCRTVDIHPNLLELIKNLDDLAGEPTLIGIARAMEEVHLGVEPIQPFVRTNPLTYNRARVILRDHYELWVMTWLPGQASVPHDHTGSVCAVRVIEGTAIESCYRAASDGFVDLEYETVVHPGQVSAGQDSGIHTLRNPSTQGERLVTIHVYAPPLKDFRRFIPRPKPRVQSQPQLVPPTVAVIGGGFSGSMTAAQILKGARRNGTRIRVALAERRGSVGEGVAYSTRETEHLLNVPAGRMSAWPDRPNDFFDWAKEKDPGVKPGDFLPRTWYGEYVRQTLHETARDAQPLGELVVLLDEARRVARHPAGGWMIHMERGTSMRADAVVLAIGHRPPSDPLARVWKGNHDRFIGDPWRPFAFNAIRPNEEVLVLGTGLTAVDTVLSLAREGRTAPITLVSRRGFVPQVHLPQGVHPVDMSEVVRSLTQAGTPLSALRLSKTIRRIVKTKAAEGVDWRAVVDGLRPHLGHLWQSLSLHQRQKFLGALRPFWEIHRHRMAGQIGETFHRLMNQGLVRILKGRVTGAEAGPQGVGITLRETGTGKSIPARFDWVVNCTGPVPSNRAEANPVIGSLLVNGWVRADELSLGIETAPTGEALNAQGEPVPDLFVVGTLRKPATWESTAVPELRQQAAAVGEAVLQRIEGPASVMVGQAI